MKITINVMGDLLCQLWCITEQIHESGMDSRTDLILVRKTLFDKRSFPSFDNILKRLRIMQRIRGDRKQKTP